MADNSKPRPNVFREQRPELSQDEIAAAAKETRVVASFTAQPIGMSDGTIAAIAFKWKLGNGTSETIIMDRYPALILRMMFDHLEKNNWTGTTLLPPDATLQ